MATIEKRKQSDGTITFRVKVRSRGQKGHSKTFTRLTDAKMYIRQVENAIDEGKFYRQIEGKKHTVADAIDRFIVEGRIKKDSTHQQTSQLNWWKELVGHMFIADFNSATFLECRVKFLTEKTRRGVRRQPQTFNRYRAPLSRVLRSAIQWRWIDNHPLQALERETEPPGKDRYLSEDEIQRLVEAAKASSCEALECIVVLALSTGMRRNEVRYLKWSDVDLRRGVIILRDTKNSEKRRVPVRGRALELLTKHGKVRSAFSDFVFTGKMAAAMSTPLDIRGPFVEAVKKAKIKDFTFHGLRHSCASYLAMNGASELEISEVLGHKTLQMVKRYSHLRDSHTAEVVERMNRKIFG